jgi:hypothetical protein
MVDIAGSKKAAGVRTLSQNPQNRIIRRQLIMRMLPPDHAAPPVATVLFRDGFVLPPLGRLDRKTEVGKHRAPFPGAASRLSATNSNILHQPLIHPYPLRQFLFHGYYPRLLIKRISERIIRKKIYRTGRAGDISAGVRIL